MAILSLLPCGLVVVVCAALLAMVDVRTGRGYALGILSALLLACTIIVVVTITLLAQVQPQPTTPHTYSVTVLLLFYFVPAIYGVLITLLGAAIVAGIAGHWRWIVGFVVAALVPVLLAVPPHPSLFMNIDYVVRQVGFLGMLVAPEATVLAYSITRLVHPVAPASARYVVPLS